MEHNSSEKDEINFSQAYEINPEHELGYGREQPFIIWTLSLGDLCGMTQNCPKPVPAEHQTAKPGQRQPQGTSTT